MLWARESVRGRRGRDSSQKEEVTLVAQEALRS